MSRGDFEKNRRFQFDVSISICSDSLFTSRLSPDVCYVGLPLFLLLKEYPHISYLTKNTAKHITCWIIKVKPTFSHFAILFGGIFQHQRMCLNCCKLCRRKLIIMNLLHFFISVDMCHDYKQLLKSVIINVYRLTYRDVSNCKRKQTNTIKFHFY